MSSRPTRVIIGGSIPSFLTMNKEDLIKLFPLAKIVYYNSETDEFEFNEKKFKFDSRLDNEAGMKIDRTAVRKLIRLADVIVYMKDGKPDAFSPKKLMLDGIRNVGAFWLPRFRHMYIEFNSQNPQYAQYIKASILEINKI